MTMFTVVVAYIFLFCFSKRMSSLEYPSPVEYQDRYVQRHSVIIRGVNRDIGTEEAAKKIGKVFEQRFGKSYVISCNTYRQSKQPQKLYRKVTLNRKKFEQARDQEFETGKSEIIQVGERLKCNRRTVNSREYFEQKYKKALDTWEKAKDDYKTQNEGVVIVVFKNNDCVKQSIEELDLVKERLVGKPQYNRLNIQDWEIKEGLPPADIIWYNVSKLLLDSQLSGYKAFFIPLFSSMMITFAILTLERLSELWVPVFAPLFIQLTTTAIVIEITYHTPFKVYKTLMQEPHWLRTTRDQNYTVRLLTIQFTNILIVPLIFNIVYWYLQSDKIQLAEALALTQGFYLRQGMQLILIFIYYQATIASKTIIKAINDQLKVNGKYKFSHFLHDLSLRCITVVLLFAYGLVLSLVMPLLSPVMLALFVMVYLLDKYNLIFVYPIEFDSQIINRETLVKYSILAVVGFQMLMLALVAPSTSNGLILFYVLVIGVQCLGLQIAH